MDVNRGENKQLKRDPDDMPKVLSSSYGNDSIAMIQWAHERDLRYVTVVYIDTMWSAPGWDKRVALGEAIAESYGFETIRLGSIGFEKLVRDRKGFPWQAQQFCTLHLKCVPFLAWLDEIDEDLDALVMIGKRRAESKARAHTQQFVHKSEMHGQRTLWQPLYLHTDEERDALVKRAGAPLLNHRSQDCSPCVNANRQDFLMLTTEQIERVNALEVEIGKPMFRPKRYKTVGIYGVMMWAKYGRNKKDVEDVLEEEGCGSPFGCRL